MPELHLSDILSCLADYDPKAVPVAQAQEIIARFIEPIHAVEKVALRSTLGRVLAQDVLSPIDVPAHDNSAMDGYALRGADVARGGEFVICGTIFAGPASTFPVPPGQCVRIMTGGVMPSECDTVVPQELTQGLTQAVDGWTGGGTGSGTVIIPAAVVPAGANRRLQGEDLAAGRPALQQGKLIRPADLGLLASLGMAEVPVQRRLRVAFFSTGDELRSIGETLNPGCVYDSNRYTLFGMLTRLGVDLIDMGIIDDQPEQLEQALRNACENADAVITSGGVSVGAADYTKRVMAKLGEVAFWSINMQPGRPMAFGRIQSNGHQAYLFGLPGNPVAVMMSFYFFARAALYHLMGAVSPPLPLLRARAQVAMRKKPGRTEYQRGILSHDAQGLPQVCTTGAQGSGILRSMTEANCIIVLPQAQGSIAVGDEVELVLFEGLL